MKIVVIGGVAGGASFAARMRRLDEKAEIIMLESGEYIAFANCGLPYHIGGVIKNREDLILFSPEVFSQRFNVDVRVRSEATDIDPKNRIVSVKNLATGTSYEIPYDRLVISTGAEPVKLKMPGIELEGIFTLRNIPDMDKIERFIATTKAKSAVIAGGGYIGVEVAENLTLKGIKTTIVERSEHLVTPMDYDMATMLHSYIREKGITLKLNTSVTAIEKRDKGLSVVLDNESLDADMVLMAVGVRPESRLAAAAGLNVNKNGTIAVNENMLTSDDGIYAIGDVASVDNFVTGVKSFIPLAGPANKQGRIAANSIAGIKDSYKGTQGSAILKVFDMTVATTGINEKTAQDLKLEYGVMVVNPFDHASYYPGAERQWIKAVFEKSTGKILGAQIIGTEGVDKRCDVISAGIRAGMTGRDLRELELCYAPPFSSAKDPVNILGYAVENVVTGFLKTFQWYDVAQLPRDGSLNLIDVRNDTSEGVIDGFVNIPLMTLRDNIDKLDKSKSVYIHCFTGMTSYMACRILSGYGFNCYSLTGGYRFYKSAVNG